MTPCLFLEHLWRDVVGCVAGSHQHPVVGPQLLGKPKVADPDGVGVTGVLRIQDIGRLQIPARSFKLEID